MKKDRNELKEEFINSIASDELDQAKILEWIKEKEKQVDEFAPVIIAELADFHKSLIQSNERSWPMRQRSFQKNRTWFL